MARLSTHVLDTARGRPAAGMSLELYRLEETRVLVHRAQTNSDGRTDTPLLSGETIPSGVYELVFQAGSYLRGLGLELPTPAFLEEVVIRFGIAEATGNYHVPLLLSAYGYSTYRGS